MNDQDEASTIQISYTRYLAPDGKARRALPGFAQERDQLVELYGAMVRTRAFDTKAIALQRTGRLGTYASCLGQEAMGVGVGCAMNPEDVLLPSFREHGAQLVRGVRMVELLLYWGGDERGSDFAVPREDFPVCVPVGTHAPHAAGVALAFKLRGEARAAVCVFGDGATSRGDVYEAMNLAGIWSLPVVFVINNNQWAISVPRSKQTAARTLAQKAVAVGFNGEQVDGNDVIAVRERVRAALAKARTNGGPHLIEAVTYRLSDHTTVDDARRYRSDEEVSEHWKEDPIARLRNHLTTTGLWNKKDEDRLIASCNAEVEAAAADYLAIAPQPAASMFDFLNEDLSKDLAEQRRQLIEEVERLDSGERDG